MRDVDVEKLKEMARRSDDVTLLEIRVKNWMKKLSDILKESEQIRRENDSSGKYSVFYKVLKVYYDQ